MMSDRERVIRVDNLWARIGKTEILKDINFQIYKGEFVALMGPNGAGKTTLLKHLNGLRIPTKGTVLIEGQDTRTTRTSVLSRKVGFLFQNPDHQIITNRVWDEIAFGLKHTGVPSEEHTQRIQEAAQWVGIEQYLEADPFLLPRPYRQRVALASVLALRPHILVLDEPTSAQDEQGTRLVMEIARKLQQQGTTLILVTHDMELVAEYAERALILVEGRLLADLPVEELFQQEELLETAELVKPGVYRIASAIGYPLSTNPFRRKLKAEELLDWILQRCSLPVG